jgi:hypothetical protein
MAETTPATASAAAATAAAAVPATWLLGIARFDLGLPGDRPSALQDTLPRLIAARLATLPPRIAPEDESSELIRLEASRSAFSAGAELASRLDARALLFLNPSTDPDSRKSLFEAADKLVADAGKKLEETNSGQAGAGAGAAKPPTERTAKLWDGHAKGQLIDIPRTGFGRAAKAAGVDLLVTGTISLQSGYAIVRLRGFDAALDREVLAWKGFCSVDDPGPLAEEFATRLERWAAGRDFARLDLRLVPASAQLEANGLALEGSAPVIYAFRDESLRLDASASGYAPRSEDIELALGERKSLELILEARRTGRLGLTTDPAGAAVSVDSVPIGPSPIAIELDGSRGIASVSAAGRETRTIILPAAGESDLALTLLPSDGLGPKGRIAAAKDDFYRSLGWFVLAIPTPFLTWGLFSGYNNAYALSGQKSLYDARSISVVAFSAAATATAATATFMIIKLVKYLAATR